MTPTQVHDLAVFLYGGRRYAPSHSRLARRILKDPQALIDVLVKVDAMRPMKVGEVTVPTVAAYQIITPHEHDWRWGWGLLVCANGPCPDYGKPGLKPWPRPRGWNSSDRTTWPKYTGPDPTEFFDDEDLDEDDDS